MPDGELITKHPYNDESGRFEKIAEVYKGGYSWGIACVWKDNLTGRLYGDTDSGCSCFGPFDEQYGTLDQGFEGLGSLTDIEHERDAGALLDGVSGEDETFGDGTGQVSTTERQDFVRKVRAALSAAQN